MSDIDRLDLQGPGTLLHLRRTVVRAGSVGVLLHRHPQRHAALAPIGARVHAGRAVALLRIGALLLPVTAPRDGVAARWLVDDGSVVGYGQALLEVVDWDDAHGH